MGGFWGWRGGVGFSFKDGREVVEWVWQRGGGVGVGHGGTGTESGRITDREEVRMKGSKLVLEGGEELGKLLKLLHASNA